MWGCWSQPVWGTHSTVRYLHFLQVPKSRECSFWDDSKFGEDKPPEKRVDIKCDNLSIHWQVLASCIVSAKSQHVLRACHLVVVIVFTWSLFILSQSSDAHFALRGNRFSEVYRFGQGQLADTWQNWNMSPFIISTPLSPVAFSEAPFLSLLQPPKPLPLSLLADLASYFKEKIYPIEENVFMLSHGLQPLSHLHLCLCTLSSLLLPWVTRSLDLAENSLSNSHQIPSLIVEVATTVIFPLLGYIYSPIFAFLLDPARLYTNMP